MLDARLDIYSVNFGEASRHFEAARTSLRAANARLLSLSLTEDATSLEAALTLIDEAQRFAGQLTQDANAVAGDAAKTIGDVAGVGAERDADGAYSPAAEKTSATSRASQEQRAGRSVSYPRPRRRCVLAIVLAIRILAA